MLEQQAEDVKQKDVELKRLRADARVKEGKQGELMQRVSELEELEKVRPCGLACCCSEVGVQSAEREKEQLLSNLHAEQREKLHTSTQLDEAQRALEETERRNKRLDEELAQVSALLSLPGLAAQVPGPPKWLVRPSDDGCQPCAEEGPA